MPRYAINPEPISIFTLDRFVDSIFELVDIWTETAEESEYLEMIDLLTQGITKVRPVTKGNIWRDFRENCMSTFYNF